MECGVAVVGRGIVPIVGVGASRCLPLGALPGHEIKSQLLHLRRLRFFLSLPLFLLSDLDGVDGEFPTTIPATKRLGS